MTAIHMVKVKESKEWGPMSLRHAKREEMLPYIFSSKHVKGVILKDGIDLKGNRIMENEWWIVSLLREAKNEWIAKLKL